MEIGDLVKRTFPYSDGYQNIAYVVGFDEEGDIEIVYLNPDPSRALYNNGRDLDYKSGWELIKPNA